MVWDPLSEWPRERRWVWVTVAAWVVVFQGPGFVKSFQIRAWELHEMLPDFFQDWASARNYVEGLPVYSSHAVSVKRYLGGSIDETVSTVVVNAHPPASVLLVLPFARLPLRDAFFYWNLTSFAALTAGLCLIRRGLNIPSGMGAVLPAVSLALVCNPLWQQVHQGQLNGVLLLLVAGVWASDRSGRPRLAGALLGCAAAVKLFPGFLFLLYLIRGRWKLVAAGAVSAALVTAATAAVFGPGAYRDYARGVLPEIGWFRVAWENASLFGFWSRLFDPAPERVRAFSRSVPLYQSPALARLAWLASSGVVTAVMAWSVRPAGRPGESDRAFGLAVTAMLLVSPICWDHYFLLLAVPLAVFWLGLPPSRGGRASFLLTVAVLWTSPVLVWSLFGITGRAARPWENLTVISLPFYALLSLFGIGVVESKPPRSSRPGADVGPTRTKGSTASLL